jgi:hypothetical protein
MHSQEMDMEQFSLALEYLYTIGHAVVLKCGLVYTRPSMIPKLVAKFISPKKIQLRLPNHGNDVELLQEAQIGFILGQNTK